MTLPDTREDLLLDYCSWQKDILDCDPSADEHALDTFIGLQGLEEEFETRAKALGFADLDALAEYAEALA